MCALCKNEISENRNAMRKTMKFIQIFLGLAVSFGTYPY